MTDSISNSLVNNLSTREKYASSDSDSKELGQDVFLELMVTQMQNQNPLDPQENSEFVAQLAQFSSVEGIDKLNKSMSGIAESFQSTQALQASSMVGRFVKVDSESAFLGEGGVIAGTIDVPQSTGQLTVNIYDDAGQLVSEEEIGESPAGEIVFAWDGTDSEDNALPAGYYTFEAIGNFGGDDVQLNTALSHNVDSVSVGANGTVSLNIAAVGPVSVSKVREIF